ncbi:MAG: hypothetical protein E7L17_13495, partial [Clostridium sp.]|nr:hypothetical protein [Clostridium sp.]
MLSLIEEVLRFGAGRSAGARDSAGAGFAPHAGAGTYFHERVKVGKGLPRGEYRFSPLGSPLN